MIRKILGKRQSPSISQLNLNGDNITDVKDIADTIAQTITNNSSSDNYTDQFQQFKRNTEQTPLNFKSRNSENKYSENANSCKALFIMYINKLILFTFS